jgi:TP901 family phage tail tape measure protein
MATKEIISVILDFRENLSKNITPAISALNKFQDRTETLRNALTPVSAASGLFLVGAAKSAADFSKALKEAKKGLGLTNEELKEFGNQAKQVSENLDFQVGSKEILNIATAAGKLGVAKKDLADYTEGLVKFAVANDKLDDIENLNENVAKVNAVFKMGIPELKDYYGALSVLADTTSANAVQLVDFSQQIAGTAKNANISAKSINAWGATLIDSGQTAGTAATFMRNFSIKLGAAENQSKGAREAFEKLGFSAKGLATAFSKDAQGTMIDFLEKVNELKKVDPVAANRVMASVFGAENISNANLLLGKLDDLKKNLIAVGDEQANAAKLTSEFAVSSEGLDGAMRALKNVFQEIMIEVGTAFLPGIVKAATAMLEFTKPVLAFVRSQPGIAGTIAALLGIVTVIAPILHLVSLVSTVLGMVAPLITGITAVIALIGGVAGGIGVFILAAAPVIAIIAAIAGGAYLIYSNWDFLEGWLNNFWSNLPMNAQKAWNGLVSGASWCVTGIKNFFVNLWNGISAATLSFFGVSLSNWQKYVTNSTALIKGLFTGWVNWQKWQVDTTINLLNGLMNFLKQFFVGIAGYYKWLFDGYKNVINGFLTVTKNVVTAIASVLGNIAKLIWDNTIGIWWKVQVELYSMLGKLVSDAWTFGSNFIGAFVNGIKANINKAVSAVGDMAGQMAQYLPHSPAKKGGLSMLDVNGMRFVETFISGIEKAGLTNFLNNAFVTPMNAASNTLIPQTAAAASSGNQAPINITYNISAKDSEDILKQLKSRDKQLLDLINRSSARINRQSY